MLKPSPDLVLNSKQSKYSLVVAVAKRARQITADAETKGEILTEKPVDLAVQDFIHHKFTFTEKFDPNDDYQD